MRTFLLISTLVFLVAAVYAAPVEEEDPEALDAIDENEENDPQEDVEDSDLDEVMEDEEEDPRKKVSKRRPYYIRYYRGRERLCFCSRRKKGKKSKKGDEPEESQDDMENENFSNDVVSELDSLQDEVDDDSADPKKRRKMIKAKKWKVIRLILRIKALFKKHFKGKGRCKCTRNSKIIRVFLYLHYRGAFLKKLAANFHRKLVHLVCKVSRKYRVCKKRFG